MYLKTLFYSVFFTQHSSLKKIIRKKVERLLRILEIFNDVTLCQLTVSDSNFGPELGLLSLICVKRLHNALRRQLTWSKYSHWPILDSILKVDFWSKTILYWPLIFKFLGQKVMKKMEISCFLSTKLSQLLCWVIFDKSYGLFWH